MKRIACFILCIAMLLTLCACGSNNIPEATGTNQQNTPNTNQPGVVEDIAPEDRPTLPAEGEYTLSEYLATGDTIWYYLLSNQGKDSSVYYIYVLSADGRLYWYTPNPAILLGELEQMEDADIIEMVKENYPLQQFGWNLFSAEEERNRCAARMAIFQREMIEFGAAEYYVNPDSFTIDSLRWNEGESKGFAPDLLQNAMVENWERIKQAYYELGDCFVAHSAFSPDLLDLIYQAKDVVEFETKLDAMAHEGMVPESAVVPLKEVFAKLENTVEVVFANYNTQAEAYCETIEPACYALTIVTDSTGNNTASMKLVYTSVSNSTDNMGTLSLTYEYPAGQNNSNCHTVVYDSLYGGYIVDNDNYLYTRVYGKPNLMLDEVGTYDIPIDVKDYESLFD